MLTTCVLFAGPDTTAGQKVPKLKRAVDTVTVKTKSKAKLILVLDTTSVDVRKLNGTALENYKKRPEFKYAEAGYTGSSLWTRFWDWFWKWLDLGGKNAGKTTWFWRILKYLFIIGGPAALVFLILKLSGINMLGLFRKKAYSPLAYTTSEENIHEINFETEIEKAVAAKNYRLAVRLLYLRSLKQLSDNGLINWKIDKTNTDYVSELADEDQRAEFKQLTLQFEYAWYGDFLITGESYKRISQLFGSFKTKAA
ncbi:hypothetical protein A0256_03815 [Mucilaginibacter sp. PAMC 26640]|nr:hypothetical protein A0256_03815 [Mucilaginibacter sp. PAMC 26640]